MDIRLLHPLSNCATEAYFEKCEAFWRSLDNCYWRKINQLDLVFSVNKQKAYC